MTIQLSMDSIRIYELPVKNPRFNMYHNDELKTNLQKYDGDSQGRLKNKNNLSKVVFYTFSEHKEPHLITLHSGVVRGKGFFIIIVVNLMRNASVFKKNYFKIFRTQLVYTLVGDVAYL